MFKLFALFVKIFQMLVKIKSIFTPPENEYSNIFERTKFILSYRITLFLIISLSLLTSILFLFFEYQHCILTFIGFVVSSIAFYFIRKTGKYKIIILFFNLIGAFLCIYTLYAVKDKPHIVDGLWMIISAMLTFLTLGKNWGTFITVAHGIALSLFYLFFLNDQIAFIADLNQAQLFAYAFNILICFFIIYYLNWQNIKITQEAELQIGIGKSSLEQQLELINKQNHEKTILLKEIHHRVKNNLQVIVSLLRLQQKDITNQEEVSKFNESINRVIAMSLIHEKIYQTGDFSSIDLEDYFETLANDMVSSFQTDKKIEFDINSSVLNLSLKPIVPIALIFNELLSNSIKYAFFNIEQPTISVHLTNSSDGQIQFIYADNGNWKEPEQDNSLGIELIDALTEQLNGKYILEKALGTKYHFYFDKIKA